MQLYVGIDWADQEHVVCCLRPDRSEVAEFSIEHDQEGLDALVEKLSRLSPVGEVLVGIETAHNSIYDHLLDAGYTVAVIHPNKIHQARRSHVSSGAKSDREDARTIARHLINEEDRLRILKPDSEQTRALRSLAKYRVSVVEDMTASMNRLTSLLKRHNPAALGHFRSIRSKVCRALLLAYPSHESLCSLSIENLRAFLKAQNYRNKVTAESMYERIHSSAPGSRGLDAEIASIAIRHEVQKLNLLLEQEKLMTARMSEMLDAHPDGKIFRSLPNADTVLATEILTAFGDDRDRFPTAESLASLIGLSPVTVASGKYRSVQFRRSCQRSGRRAFHLWVNLTRRSNEWVEQRYRTARDQGKRHPHALRVIGRSWLRIIHACWRTRVEFDPNRVKNRTAVEIS